MSIKVLVVDDSLLIRSLLAEIIKQTPGMELVGAAADAFAAKDMVIKLKPDVITLDIEMPKVNGLTFLDRLMKAQPTPVIMISTLTQKGADATIRSLELGAVDFIAKPKLDIVNGISKYQQEIVDKIRKAARTTPKARLNNANNTTPIPIRYTGNETIVAIGASAGGTTAISQILEPLSATFPATLITQHMPSGFTESFAKRLNSICYMTVQEAQDGALIHAGNAYIAPGNKHMQIIRNGANYHIGLSDGPLVCGHKPAVDVMFYSLAHVVGKNTIATILTGMGKDGAKGLLALRKKGAITMAQDEASCVVYGMPKAAVEIGATEHIIPLDKISRALVKAVEQKQNK